LRAFRFLRSRARVGLGAAARFADEPRMLQAWCHGWDTEHYLRLLRWRDQGFRPQCIYDIGAHRGAWSEMCQSLFAPGKVYLFEPQSDLLSPAGLARRQPHWEIVPVALGAQKESRAFYLTENISASSCLKPESSSGDPNPGTRSTREVPVTIEPLDQWAGERHVIMPELVKIDVQGFEGEVLAGGRSTIAQAQRVVVEVSLRKLYEAQSKFTAILAQLEAMDFELDDLSDAHRDWPSGVLWQVDLWLRKKGL
jgi:FkbM family methyltransferase